MTDMTKNTVLFAIVFGLIVLTGIVQGPNVALTLFNMGLVSAIVAIGVNLQWGFAGLFNVGVMGFIGLGGLATVLVAMPPEQDAWAAGGVGVLAALALGAATIVAVIITYGRMAPGRMRTLAVTALLIVGFFVFRSLFVHLCISVLNSLFE